MGNPLLRYDGLELHWLEGWHIEQFRKNVSAENMREFVEFYEIDADEALAGLIDEEYVHSVLLDGEVLAICGVDDGLMWAIFSKGIKKHWRKFVKASPALINFYHMGWDDLRCEVWDRNLFVHQWLSYIGFRPEGVVNHGGNKTSISFVRCADWFDTLDSKSPPRPVLH